MTTISCPYCSSEINATAWAESALDLAIAQLHHEVSALAVLLPDLPARHKRLIDSIIDAVRDWEATR